MRRAALFAALLVCLALAACGKPGENRVSRLKAISAELKSMEQDKVKALIQKAGGMNVSEDQLKRITISLPSGMSATLEEVRNAMILEVLGTGNPNAGTWEDDARNWHRAFDEETPAEVAVVHSRYWESNHFTREYLYFFVVKASPEWRDAFLKKRGLVPVEPGEVWSYRSTRPNGDIPAWYAPDPVAKYEVWDLPGYHGSVFIDRATGEIHFEGGQL